MSDRIVAEGLYKKFGDFQAVSNVSFRLPAGKIIGLLGPNGAGKTTTLRMLAGLLRPSAGTAYINGHSVQDEQLAARQDMGFLTGDMDLYRRLTPPEVLQYFGDLYEVPKDILAPRIQQLIADFGITDFQNKRCENLSTGQKQRVAIARTLINDPPVVILDEPTTGLDIMASEFILQLIRQMAEKGKTVLFSTHHLEEVDRLCDGLLIISKGTLVHDGTAAALLEQTGKATLAKAFFSLVSE